MDGECAFCGRTMASSQRVFCDDCGIEHEVCYACADEARSIEGLRLAA